MNSERPATKRRGPLSIWDLPASLLTSVHKFRRRKRKQGIERKHCAAILAFVYRSRFATAEQIRRRFTNTLRSSRTARRHLAEMHESLGYLELVPTPSPLWPKVYSVSRRGLRKLADTLDKKQKSWEPSVNDRGRIGFSIHHVIHELFCTEAMLRVFEATRASNGIELLATERRSLAKNDAFLLPGAGRVIPDGMFLLRQAGEAMILTFLEIDTGTMSLKSVVEKLRRYSLWAESARGKCFVTDVYRKHGAASPQAKFRLAIICGRNNRADGQQRLKNLVERSARLPPTIRNAIWLTTSMAVRDSQSVVRSEIWHRAADMGKIPIVYQCFLVTPWHSMAPSDSPGDIPGMSEALASG